MQIKSKLALIYLATKQKICTPNFEIITMALTSKPTTKKNNVKFEGTSYAGTF